MIYISIKNILEIFLYEYDIYIICVLYLNNYYININNKPKIYYNDFEE